MGTVGVLFVPLSVVLVLKIGMGGACPISSQVTSALSDPTKFMRKGFSLCKVEKNEELLNPATEERSTRNIEFELSSDSDIT